MRQLLGAVALAVMLSGAGVPACAAGEGVESPSLAFRLEALEAGSGYLWVDFSLLHALEGNTREDLRHGRPLTLLYTVELWRERSHWFDALESSHTLEIRLRYDPWQELYLVAGLGPDLRQCLSLEEVEALVAHHLHVKCAPLGRLRGDASYYVMLRADLKTLTLRDLGEVEGWFRGEVRAEGAVGGLALPRSLLRVLLGFSGLGDRTAFQRSSSFPGTRLGLPEIPTPGSGP